MNKIIQNEVSNFADNDLQSAINILIADKENSLEEWLANNPPGLKLKLYELIQYNCYKENKTC